MSVQAAQFTAANSEYLSVASNADLNTGDIDFSVFGWVYTDSLGAARILTKYNTTGNQRAFSVGIAASSIMTVLANANGSSAPGDTTLTATAFGALSTNTWYFFVAWHDATADTINVQINNGTTYSAAHTTGVFATSTAPFILGARGNIDVFWNGRQQHIGLTKRLLTADEKTFLYNEGAGREYSELTTAHKVSMVSWWALTETSGTRSDSHSTNHLTDNNTVTSAGSFYDIGVWTSAGVAAGSFVGEAIVGGTVESTMTCSGSATASLVGMAYSTIAAAITARVKAHAALNALVAGKVYDGKAPQGAVAPFLVWQLISATRPRTFGKRAQIVRARIQIDAYAASQTASARLKAQVAEAFDVWSSDFVLQSELEDERDFVEMMNTSTELRRGSMDFIMNYTNQEYA